MYHNIEQQLSLEIANAPEEIARISDLLSSNCVNANAMSVAEGVYRGYFRFLTDQVEEAKSVLISNGLDVDCERVISVRLDDKKGQVAKITSALARANINIDYFYASVDRSDSATHLIMKVENVVLATSVLDEISDVPVGPPELSLV